MNLKNKNMKKLILNPNEMAIRKVYWPLVLNKQMTTFFRPNVRLCTNVRGYCESQNITLRCILQTGSDILGIAPQFVEGENIEARVAHIYDKKISELVDTDFIGSSPDITSITNLKYHLGLIYNLSYNEIDEESYVTIIKLDYKETRNMEKIEVKRLENLLQNGMWAIAQQVPDNAQDLLAEELMVTLISHDYPAQTPLLWGTAFSHFGIKAKSLVLVPNITEISQDDLRYTFSTYRDDSRFKLGGLGVGFKDEALSLLDILDDSAANVGAANFVLKNEDNKLVGYNTDGEGFVNGLLVNFPELENLENKKVLLLGSGGTANAVAFALAKNGAKLIIANRTVSKAQALAKAINSFYDSSEIARGISENEIEEHLHDLDLLINASTKGAEGVFANYLAISGTASGLESNRSEGERLFSLIDKKTIIADIVLRLVDTPLIVLAKRQGFKTIDGVPMVISQAALAFTLAYEKSQGITFGEVYEVMKKTNK